MKGSRRGHCDIRDARWSEGERKATTSYMYVKDVRPLLNLQHVSQREFHALASLSLDLPDLRAEAGRRRANELCSGASVLQQRS